MSSKILVQILRNDIFKNIVNIFRGRSDIFPIIFDNVHRKIKINMNCFDVQFFITLKNIDYFIFSEDDAFRAEEAMIIPLNYADLETLYKNLGSSKYQSIYFEYILEEDQFNIYFTGKTGKYPAKNIKIKRTTNPEIIMNNDVGFSPETIIHIDEITRFKDIISTIGKDTARKWFKIHYNDHFFSILMQNDNENINTFGTSIDEHGILDSHVCNAKCREFKVNILFIKLILIHLKTLNKTQMSISFKEMNPDNTLIRFKFNLGEIGNMVTII